MSIGHQIIVPVSDYTTSAVLLQQISYINKKQLIQKGTESMCVQCKKKDFQETQRTKHVCLWNILTVCLNP